ncbi:P1 family peptidase [Nocardioides donggukensis]|uniref:P1 family peptidase n=1 Tax=Nocardioides donggukensis TaxID=2774019 RepID=A0A927K2V8_9ACTN|nr:P1 family peptidase [Nocardioides donggukensis]MBD8868701.1 P1 family peptidase [Nocardioides donggukensis]
MNAITDVPGIRVGQAERTTDGWLSGSTVVLPPPQGAVAGVDVRGGGPGTRETDLLDPRNLVDRVHAVVLTGGSALGLAAVDGVVQRLFAAGTGLPVGGPGEVVPIVPAAVLYDLGRGGAFGSHPDADLGAAAYDAALEGAGLEVREGNHGAGTGARVGGLKGGVGSASVRLGDGSTVGALVAVNAVGSAVHLGTGELLGARHCLPGDLPPLRRPDPAELEAALAAAARLDGPLRPPLATTIGVIATDAALTKAQCAKLAGIGHDGLARAIDPVHTMFDGDTLFALATGSSPAPDVFGFQALLAAAGTCVTRAITRGVLAATSTHGMRCYRDAFGSALA